MLIKAIAEIAEDKHKTKELTNRSSKKIKEGTSFSELLEKEIKRLGRR